MNLIIDVGNTFTKIAVFNKNRLVKKVVSDKKKLQKDLVAITKQYDLQHGIVSSVGTFDKTVLKKLPFSKDILILDNQTKVLFKNKYKTPKTLGVDRIALANGAAAQFPAKNTLVIDAGTCITYDFINHKNEYLGGAISPGVAIRYKSLNDYTANLPLLEKGRFSLIGKDTESSIHSGVLNGFICEIDGVIEQYSAKYQTLTVVLTGGDTNFLAKKLKSTIFANPNFLLEGLNSILIHNLDE